MTTPLAVTRFKPTLFTVSNGVKKLIKQNKSNNDVALAIKKLQNQVIQTPTKRRTFGEIIIDMIRPRVQLIVNVSKNGQDELVLNTTRKVNNFFILGKEVPLDISKLVKDPQEAVRVLNESKQGILETINKIKKGS